MNNTQIKVTPKFWIQIGFWLSMGFSIFLAIQQIILYVFMWLAVRI